MAKGKLKLKVELPGSHWSKTVQVWRYRAEAFGHCSPPPGSDRPAGPTGQDPAY